MKTTATARATPKQPAITTTYIETLVEEFGEGFSLVRRVEPPFKPNLRREIWTDGETVLLFERGEIRKGTIQEALKRWNLPTDEDADPAWFASGEEKWIGLLMNQLFVKFSPAEKSAISLCAARYDDGDETAYLRSAVTSQLEGDLGGVADALKQ